MKKPLALLAMVLGAMLQPAPAQEMPSAQVKQGAIPHEPLLRRVLPNTANQEVMVFEAEYAPGGINPRHFHPAAITFHILSGTGIFQEDGKPPVTLRAGESLFVPTGTIHSHWNPSTTENLRFVEFIVAEKDKGRSIPRPLKNGGAVKRARLVQLAAARPRRSRTPSHSAVPGGCSIQISLTPWASKSRNG